MDINYVGECMAMWGERNVVVVHVHYTSRLSRRTVSVFDYTICSIKMLISNLWVEIGLVNHDAIGTGKNAICS